MDGLGPEASRLLLVGEADATENIAADLSGGAPLSIQDASAEMMEAMGSDTANLVVIELPMPDIIARLRAGGGEERPVPTALIDALVGCSIAQVERVLILRTLEHCQGNRTSAATVLGISVRTSTLR